MVDARKSGFVECLAVSVGTGHGQGIAAEDAVYLPAVETALSLVHEVHPRVGESVAVFGQGMIG